MDRRFWLCIGLAVSLISFENCISVKVSSDKEVDGLTVVCPQADMYLPDYPSFDDKEAFYNDSVIYERAKKLRDTPRGQLAAADASTGLDYYLARFGEAMGIELGSETTAVVATYVETTYSFARSGISNAKNAYHRLRPYKYFQESSGISGPDMFGAYQSYPSGHSVRAWAIALALMAIDEEHQYEIIKTGYELGESRVIVGYHYESDVEAARLAASVAFARLVTDKYYMKLMDKAKSELDSIKAQIKTAI